MKTRIFLFVFAVLCIGCNCSQNNANFISDYKLVFYKSDTVGSGSFNISFRIEPWAPDTLRMRFGSRLYDYMEYDSDSTVRIDVHGYNVISTQSNNQYFEIVRKRGLPSIISMRYHYGNIAVVIASQGKQPIAEVWETSCEEYYYPFVPQAHMDIHAEIIAPEGQEVLCSYPVEKRDSVYVCDVKNAIAHSLQIAFLDTGRLRVDTMQVPHPIRVFQVKNHECSEERFNNIAHMLSAAHGYFCDVYKCLPKHKVQALLLADSMITGGGARYNINFISAPQYKAAMFDYITPLAHEVGHIWLGEYNLLLDDGQPGAYFIKESINEFMTGMFVRTTYGEEAYNNYRIRIDHAYEFSKIKGTEYDRALIDMRYNSNHAVVYDKGPLILDEFAQRIGYDEMVRIIAEFYRRYDLKSGLRYEDFISTVAELHPEIANELDQRLRSI